MNKPELQMVFYQSFQCWAIIEDGKSVAMLSNRDDAETLCRQFIASGDLLEACKAMRGELILSQYAGNGDFTVVLAIADSAIAQVEPNHNSFLSDLLLLRQQKEGKP